MALAVALGAIVAIAVAYAATYHGIVLRDDRCDNAWQAIESQLVRRNAIIARLMATVRDSGSQESDAIADVADARDAVASAHAPQSKMAASDELSDALDRLMVSARSCPELASSPSFRQLQADLTEAERGISQARSAFNDCVLDYNDSISTPPGSIVASARFRSRQAFDALGDPARHGSTVRF